MAKLLKTWWFIIVFFLGIIGTVYQLQAQQNVTNETIKELKEAVKDKEKDLKDNEKIDVSQTISLERLSIIQGQMIKTLDSLNEKIEKGDSK